MKIKGMIKGGQLIEIEPEEVSLVKHPANKRRFLFTKAADLEINIKTDQTFGGSTVTVNGEPIEDLDSFYFNLTNWDDKDIEDWGAQPVSGSWSTRVSSEDGIDKMETYSLQAMENNTMTKADVIKLIKSEFGVEIPEADFDALAEEKRLSLAEFALYVPAMNEPMKKGMTTAITAMVKTETSGESEETPEGSEDPPASSGTDDTKTTDERLKELTEQVAALAAKLEVAPEPEPEPEPDADAEIQKQIKAMSDKLDKIADAAGVKNSEDQDATIQKGSVVEDLYKSIKID